jgi:hypothetical protein
MELTGAGYDGGSGPMPGDPRHPALRWESTLSRVTLTAVSEFPL